MKPLTASRLAWSAGLAAAAAVSSALIAAPVRAQDAPAATPAPAAPAQGSAVTLDSAVGIERVEIAADGSSRTVIKAPGEVVIVPGDRIVFTLRYANRSSQPVSGFEAVNPIPQAVQFVSVSEDWAQVSTDGGKTFGRLADLRVTATDTSGTATSRAAGPEDVTAIRWTFTQPLAAGATGALSYRGTVR